MTLSSQAIILLLVTLVVAVATLLHHSRALAGRVPERRPLRALDALRLALGRGAETGRVIHISPGSGAIGSQARNRVSSAQTIAGLLLAERIVAEAALNGAPVIVTSGDAVAHFSLRGTVRQAYQTAGQSQDYTPVRVQLMAHDDPTAYAVGVTSLYARQKLEASLIAGALGQEVLLITEEGAQRDLPQVFGSAQSAALPLMMLTSSSTLIGEEMFAAEAYLTSAAAPKARLLTQDLLRTVVILLILAGLVYALLQPVLGLPALASL